MAEALFPPRWHEVVRLHFANTVGYVVAQTSGCLEVQTQELKSPKGRVRGRDFQPLRPADLRTLRLPESWFMGVILCPGDDGLLYREWYKGLGPKERDRVVFFFHPAFGVDALDKHWTGAGLPPPRTQRFNGSWENFHHLYGRRHGDRVCEDRPPSSGH